MIALFFGIGILCLVAIIDFFYSKEINKTRLAFADMFNDLINEKSLLEEQCHTVEVCLEQEIEALKSTLDYFADAKDPDSKFPAMESSIVETSAKANLELLLKIRDDLFPPQ